MAAGQPCEEGRYTIWMSADLDCRISNPGLSIYSRSAVVPETAPSDRSISSRVVRDRERVLLCRYPCEMGENRRKWRPGTAATALVDVRGVQGIIPWDHVSTWEHKTPLAAGRGSGQAARREHLTLQNGAMLHMVEKSRWDLVVARLSFQYCFECTSLMPRPNRRARAASGIAFLTMPLF